MFVGTKSKILRSLDFLVLGHRHPLANQHDNGHLGASQALRICLAAETMDGGEELGLPPQLQANGRIPGSLHEKIDHRRS